MSAYVAPHPTRAAAFEPPRPEYRIQLFDPRDGGRWWFMLGDYRTPDEAEKTARAMQESSYRGAIMRIVCFSVCVVDVLTPEESLP